MILDTKQAFIDSLQEFKVTDLIACEWHFFLKRVDASPKYCITNGIMNSY